MTAESKSDRQDTQTTPARSAGMSRRLVIISASLLFVLACATVFWLSERQARQMKIGFPHFSEQTFTLIDQTGAARTNDDFAGAPIALFFGYSYCPDVCPMTLSLLQASLDDLAETGIDGTALQVIFVTVDAERDTPEQLAAYLSLFDMPVTALTGDAETLLAAQKTFGIYAKRVENDDGVVLWDHSAAVYLYDQSGAFSGTILFEEPAEFVLQKMQRLLR